MVFLCLNNWQMMYDEPSQKGGFFVSKKMLLLGVGGLFAVIIAAAMLMLSPKDEYKPNIQHLSARYETVLKTMNETSKNIRSAELLKLNSEAVLVLTSDSTAMTGLAKAFGEVPKDVKEMEADTSSTKKLEEARLLSNFDAVYRTYLRDKFASLRSLLSATYAETKNPTNQAALRTANKNIVDLNERLTKLEP